MIPLSPPFLQVIEYAQYHVTQRKKTEGGGAAAPEDEVRTRQAGGEKVA